MVFWVKLRRKRSTSGPADARCATPGISATPGRRRTPPPSGRRECSGRFSSYHPPTLPLRLPLPLPARRRVGFDVRLRAPRPGAGDQLALVRILAAGLDADAPRARVAPLALRPAARPRRVADLPQPAVLSIDGRRRQRLAK